MIVNGAIVNFPVIVVLIALFIPWAVSAYFSYIGGVMGKPETRLLHPLGLGMMVIALTAAVVVSIQMNTWTFRTHVSFQLVVLTVFVLIICTPIGCYDEGKKEKNKRRFDAEREAAEKRAAR
jgi:hypothetical protein